MKIRELRMKDLPFMLEWMHDISVVHDLKGNFLEKTAYDCEQFINRSNEGEAHFAITDDLDTYMGTVSLKNISTDRKCAEFAIVVRSCAMGQGYSGYAMDRICRIASEKYGLKYIYWYADKKNVRAVRFYDKNGFTKADSMAQINKILKLDAAGVSEEEAEKYCWYFKRLA